MRTFISFAVTLLLSACGSTVTTTPSVMDVPAHTSLDASIDVGVDAQPDIIVTGDCGAAFAPCAPPPMGCRYVSEPAPPCTRSCGRLVCEDAGVDAAPDAPDCGTAALVPCPPPPMGCSYVSESPPPCGGGRCGTLVCPDAGSDVPPTTDAAIVCSGTGAGSFPTFDSTCSMDTDCVVGVHQTDCCGNMRGLGFRSSQRAAFDTAEGVCRPMYPGCGCPSMGILCDDAQRTFSPMGVGVACRAGRCTTFVRAM